MFDPNVTTWGQAFGKVSYWQAFLESGVDMVGTKKLQMFLNSASQMASYAYEVGLSNVTTEGLLGAGLMGFMEPIVGDAIGKYGKKGVAKGLQKLGLGNSAVRKLMGWKQLQGDLSGIGGKVKSFQDFENGQGFSGVIDLDNNDFIIRPSNAGALPITLKNGNTVNTVERAGGHADVRTEMENKTSAAGINLGTLGGFSIQKTNNNTLHVGFTSGTINNAFGVTDRQLPSQYRNQVVEQIQKAYPNYNVTRADRI
jgi:hypothetical protein